MVIKVHLKIGEDFFCTAPFFFGVCVCVRALISLVGTEWCDQKYHTVLYITVVDVCS
jgi:hypothetical protein